jgi:hypothetical protein
MRHAGIRLWPWGNMKVGHVSSGRCGRQRITWPSSVCTWSGDAPVGLGGHDPRGVYSPQWGRSGRYSTLVRERLAAGGHGPLEQSLERLQVGTQRLAAFLCEPQEALSYPYRQLFRPLHKALPP